MEGGGGGWGAVQKLESESRGDGGSVAGLLQPLKPSTDVGCYLGAPVEAVLRIKDKTRYPKWERAGFLSRDRSRAKIPQLGKG